MVARIKVGRARAGQRMRVGIHDGQSGGAVARVREARGSSVPAPARTRPRQPRRVGDGPRRPDRNQFTRPGPGRLTKRLEERLCFDREVAAYRLLAGLDCVPRLLATDPERLLLELEHRGTPIEALDPQHRPPVDQVIDVLAQLHARGFIHADFHGGNILADTLGRVSVVDFEMSAAQHVPLRDAYDLTGRGAAVDPRPGGMHWDHRHRKSMRSMYGLTASQAYERYVAGLQQQVRRASGFRPGERHDRDGRIYHSFTHPLFSMPHAQRDTAARLDVLGLHGLSGSALDLGSNLGAMSLACAQAGAAKVTGVELDSERVRLARRIAAVCGLHDRVSFEDAEILAYLRRAEPVGLVLALAVDAWVSDPGALYSGIARVAQREAIIESNRPTRERAEVRRVFEGLGWRVEQLGSTAREDAFGTDRTIFRCTRG